MAQTRLEQIIAAHRETAQRDTRATNDLLGMAQDTPPPKDFKAALMSDGMSVIAEIKRRSPSAGDLNSGLNPRDIAMLYESAGAACLSVLTDEAFFGGSISDLQEAKSVVSLPILRKDFTVCVNDVLDARIMGADAILLIVAALSDSELIEMFTIAKSLQLSALFEVHDEDELSRALDCGAEIVGVNQRNLHTFEIDRDLAPKLRPLIPDGVISVAESGIRDVKDASRIKAAGFDAALVGSALVTAGSPAEMLSAITGAE